MSCFLCPEGKYAETIVIFLAKIWLKMDTRYGQARQGSIMRGWEGQQRFIASYLSWSQVLSIGSVLVIDQLRLEDCRIKLESLLQDYQAYYACTYIECTFNMLPTS